MSMTEVGEVRCVGLPAGVSAELEIVAKRWSPQIILVLLDGPTHFNALARAIPKISRVMLTERLRELESLGLLARHEVRGPRQAVKYQLTFDGEALRPALREIETWATRRSEERARDLAG